MRVDFILLSCDSTKTWDGFPLAQEIFSTLGIVLYSLNMEWWKKKFWLWFKADIVRKKQVRESLPDRSCLCAYSASSRKRLSCSPYDVQFVLMHKDITTIWERFKWAQCDHGEQSKTWPVLDDFSAHWCKRKSNARHSEQLLFV